MYNELEYMLNKDWLGWIVIDPQDFNDSNYWILVRIIEYSKQLEVDYSLFSKFYRTYNQQ